MESQYIVCLNPHISRRVLSHADWVGCVLDSLVYPSESQLAHPWYQTSAAQAHLGMIGYVAGEFYRLEFDSKFKLWRLPRGRGSEYQVNKKSVEINARLWVRVWRMLERMESMGRLPLPPHLLISTSYYPPQSITSMWLSALVMEGELVTPWLDYIPDGSSGFEALRKQQQNDNRRLQGIGNSSENPFENPFETTCTRLFIKNAMDTAGEFDQFRKHFYNPMVRQRQSVTAFMVKQKFMAFDMDGKPSRQGRSKKA